MGNRNSSKIKEQLEKQSEGGRTEMEGEAREIQIQSDMEDRDQREDIGEVLEGEGRGQREEGRKGNDGEEKENGKNVVGGLRQRQRSDQPAWQTLPLPNELNLPLPLTFSNPQSHLNSPQLSNRSLTPLPSSRPSEPDREEALNIFTELIANEIPGTLAKEVRKSQCNRTLLLWLKSNPESESEKQRDSVLGREGYEVCSSDSVQTLTKRYKQSQQSTENVYFSILILFSFSERGDNDEVIKQLQSFFLDSKIAKCLCIVKPPNQKKYNLYLQNIKISQKIIEIPFQIQSIKSELSRLQIQLFRGLRPNITFLRYWPKRQQFSHLIEDGDSLEIFRIKNKIVLNTCLRVGRSVIAFAKNTQIFKRLLYQYTIFHDLYFDQKMVDKSQRQENYLKRFGLKLLEDPLKFYLTPSHEVLINRMMKFRGDQLPDMANVMLPVSLVYEQILEKFTTETQKKKYKNEFVCYASVDMTEKEIEGLKENRIFQNLSFLKAQTNKNSILSSSNVMLIIYVPSKHRKTELQTGYCFLQPYSGDEEEQLKAQHYFKGYKYVIFNLLNSFRIMQVQHNKREGRYHVQLQYGEISRQIWLRECENYISGREEVTQRNGYQTEEITFSTIINHESNMQIISQIKDFGDGYSLLSLFPSAILYYERLFKKNKAEMMQNSVLLSSLQQKKGFVFQLQNKLKSALEYYYNASNLLTKGKNIEEQKNLHFGQQLEKLYQDSFRVMLRGEEYQKVIRLGESLIKSSRERGGVSLHSELFQIEMYRYIACSFFQSNVERYQIRGEDARIHHFFQQALKTVDFSGEFHPAVAQFYYPYARTLLIQRRSYDCVIYLSKAILILKTIYTQHDPKLIPYLLMLASAEYSMHDYKKANRSVKEAKALVLQYFGEKDQKMVVCLEIEARIGWRTNDEAAVKIFEQEIQLLREILQKNEKMVTGDKKTTIKNKEYVDLLCLFTKIEQTQGNSPFHKIFRPSLDHSKISFCYLYISSIYKQKCKYDEALVSLNSALEAAQTQDGKDSHLTIQIYYHMGEAEMQNGRGERARQCGQKMWRSIVRNKKQNKYEAVRYNLLMGSVHEYREIPSQAEKEVSKARQLSFKILPSLPQFQLELSKITDRLAFLKIKLDNHSQAGRLFKESEAMRNQLLKKINLKREKIRLFGLDFDDYVREVQIERCLSGQHMAWLCKAKKEYEQEKVLLRKCHEELVECVGEYHISTARVSTKRAEFQLDHEGDTTQALLFLNSALSVYQSSPNDCEARSGMIEVHCLMARVQEKRNEIGRSLQHLGKNIVLVRNLKKMKKKYIEILSEFLRIVKLILQHKNLDYLRIAYFLISDLFQRQREAFKANDNVKNIPHKDQIKPILFDLIEQLDQLSKAISSLQPLDQQKNIRRQVSPSQKGTLERVKVILSEGKKRRLQRQT